MYESIKENIDPAIYNAYMDGIETERYSLKNGDDSEPYLDVAFRHMKLRKNCSFMQACFAIFLRLRMALNRCKKKKFPGCGVLKNGASQPFFFCPDRFKIALNLQNLPCTVEITRL